MKTEKKIMRKIVQRYNLYVHISISSKFNQEIFQKKMKKIYETLAEKRDDRKFKKYRFKGRKRK
jgi:predicted TIM-barrel fold metal-dependent hydrolase